MAIRMINKARALRVYILFLFPGVLRDNWKCEEFRWISSRGCK